MSKINPEAWAILTNDEQTALNLQYGFDKSSWQVGEIMDKSHYKYLEIKYRAEKFLALFTNHFKIYHELIPDFLNVDPELKDYFTHCIKKRNKPHIITKALKKNDRLGLLQKLTSFIKDLENSEDIHKHNLLNVIKDFDRWNNFRILPKELQEPSAFKRRVKNTYKKNLKVLKIVNPLIIKKLQEVLGSKKSTGLYLPVIGEAHKIILINLRVSKKCIELNNSLNLYYFKDKKLAEDYITLCRQYLYAPDKSCKDGLEFWPKYREFIQQSANYHEVQKISPNRRRLEMAMKNLQFL